MITIYSFAPSVTSWYLTLEHLLIDNAAEVELTQWDQQQSLPMPSNQGLPSLEEVFQLRCPTLRFVPAKSRPAFARVLSSTLSLVVSDNSEEAWLKLFMLPKCLLPSSRHRGRHTKLISVHHLCDLRSKNELNLLWNQVTAMANASSPSRTHDTRADDAQRLIQSAVSLARVGLYGKACRVLQSSEIAPDNNNTWDLLQAKHPCCPLPTVPSIPTNSLLISPDFDILSMFRSFPKGTAAGPSGLRVQQLLDAVSIPLQTSICSSLRDIVNPLASGKAP